MCVAALLVLEMSLQAKFTSKIYTQRPPAVCSLCQPRICRMPGRPCLSLSCEGSAIAMLVIITAAPSHLEISDAQDAMPGSSVVHANLRHVCKTDRGEIHQRLGMAATMHVDLK